MSFRERNEREMTKKTYFSHSKEHMTAYDWFGEGRCRETDGNDKAAIEAFEKAVELNPKFGKAWYYLALARYKLGQKEEAKKAAKKAIEIKPSWKKYVKKYMPDLGI